MPVFPPINLLRFIIGPRWISRYPSYFVKQHKIKISWLLPEFLHGVFSRFQIGTRFLPVEFDGLNFSTLSDQRNNLVQNRVVIWYVGLFFLHKPKFSQKKIYFSF